MCDGWYLSVIGSVWCVCESMETPVRRTWGKRVITRLSRGARVSDGIWATGGHGVPQCPYGVEPWSVTRWCGKSVRDHLSIQTILWCALWRRKNQLAEERKSESEKSSWTGVTDSSRHEKKLTERAPEIAAGEWRVLMEDECHLVWGDTWGYAWGKRNLPIVVPMGNERERQTYDGAFEPYQKEFLLHSAPCADGAQTVTFVKYLQGMRPGKKLFLIWDQASDHRYADRKAYWAEVNQGWEEKDWRVTCLLFASAAPEQHPVEDIWLKGKNFLRRHFYQNNTFHQVKESFFHFLNHPIIDFHKLTWYI